jgi:hypothetical protein
MKCSTALESSCYPLRRKGDMGNFNDEPDDFYSDEGCCDRCNGEGWILTCCDDMCHGVGYCIHGDGMEMCSCNTTCEFPSNAPADWRWTPAKKGQ